MATAIKVGTSPPRRTVGKKASARDLSTYSGRLGAAIRARREAIGMSVADLAAMLPDVTASAIYQWEAGRHSPPADLFPVIAAALKTRVRKLMPEE